MEGNNSHIIFSNRVGYRLVFVLMILMVSSIAGIVIGQKQSNFWYFGKKAGLDFTGFDPMPLNNSKMDTKAGVAAVSDSTGKLVFYTDGMTIWNSDHTPWEPDGLNGSGSSTQSATIVPVPGIPDQYYVFSTKSFNKNDPKNYGGNFIKIQISPDGTGTILSNWAQSNGKGGLLENSTEKLLVIPFTNANGITAYWIIMHEFGNNRFVKFKLDGVLSEPFIQEIGSIHQNGTDDDGTNRGAAGQMKVNDARTRIALAVEGGKFFELFRFNVNTGVLSTPIQIPAGDANDKFAFKYGAYGVEFSPTGNYGGESTSGNFLYGTARDGGMIYQWDLASANDVSLFIKSGQIQNSNPLIRNGSLQLAPNGKIYLAFEGQNFLGVINSPMRPDCKYQSNGARLIDNTTGLGGLSEFGLPATIPIVKQPEPFYFENLCFGDETLFYITDQSSITPNTPRAWSFKKVGSSTMVTKTSQTFEYKYKFPSPGTYEVAVTVFKSGGPKTLPMRRVTINPLPVVQLIENSVRDTFQLCKGESLVLNAGPGAFYAWEVDTINVRQRVITTNDEEFYHEYRVLVTDYHGCQGWDTVLIRREIPPIATHTSVKAFCGKKDGSATVTLNGPTKNFTFEWENYPDEKTNTLSGINGGDYIVHVTSKITTCQITDTIHVEELGGSSVKIVSPGDSTACPGQQITLNVSGASEVEWLGHPELTGTTVYVTLDASTLYTIKAISRDAGRECETVVTDTVRVFPKNKPDLGADRTSCRGWTVEIDGGENYREWNWSDGQSGRIAKVRSDNSALVLNAMDFNYCLFSDTVAVNFLPSPDVNLGRDTARCSLDPITLSGGTGDTYQWRSLPGNDILSDKQRLIVNRSGDYILSITKFGCSLEDTVHVQLNDPQLFRINRVRSQDISCFGAKNGVILIDVTGEGKDFFYSIDNGLTYWDNAGVFDNVVPGTAYMIKVLEDSVCLVNHPVPVVITQPDSLMVHLCALPPSCKECTDGQIMVTISGGTAPYQILMAGFEQESVIPNLGLGKYSITITDAQGCTAIANIELLEGTRPEISADFTQAVCSGSPVTLTVLNATRVEWINPPNLVGTSITVNPLVTDTYRAKSFNTGPDGFLCETTIAYTVEVIPFVKPDLGPDISKCAGDTVNLNGGDYLSWVWNNGMKGRDITLYQSPQNPLILTVLDVRGCFLKDTITVQFFNYPEIELGKDQAVCTSDPVILNGGSGDSYLWTSNQLATAVTTQELPVVTSGKYFLRLTANGCSSVDSVSVRMLNPALFNIINITGTDNTCYGGAIGSLEIEVNGSGSSFQYSIDGGATYQSSNLFENLVSGDYSIRVAEDSLCYVENQDPFTISQPDSIDVKFRLKSPTCESCTDGQLMLQLSGGTPPYVVTLSGAPIGLTTETLTVGTYTIVVTDANSCTKTIEFKMELLKMVPNVLTLNGDGHNELWKIPMLRYYSDAVVKVFTPAGKLVFESLPGYPVPWDGTDNKDRRNPLPMGTYYYLITLGTGEEQLTGNLTILR